MRRYNLNRVRPKMKANKRKMIKQKAGELGHIDCHHLSRDLFPGEHKRHYLVGLVDDCTRLAWAEVVPDITSLTVMFTSLRIINLLNSRYQIQFEEMLSDNGAGILPTLLLITKGRKSGEQKLLPLIYKKVGEAWVVIASKGGAPAHPAWFLNLQACPEYEIHVASEKHQVRARVATGAERDPPTELPKFRSTNRQLRTAQGNSGLFA